MNGVPRLSILVPNSTVPLQVRKDQQDDGQVGEHVAEAKSCVEQAHTRTEGGRQPDRFDEERRRVDAVHKEQQQECPEPGCNLTHIRVRELHLGGHGSQEA